MKTKLIVLIFILFNSAAFSFTIVLDKKDAACGFNNGSINATIYNTVPPVTYQWSNGAMSYFIDNLAPGIYTIYVTDSTGSDSASVVIGNTTEIVGASFSYIIPPGMLGGTHPCNDQCNGIAYLLTGGMNGTPPYSIGTSMSHMIGFYAPFNCPTVEGICSDDIYTAWVTDANGCSAQINALPPAYPPTSWDHSINVIPACNGLNNGGVTIDFTDMPSFSLNANWSGPSSGQIPYFYNTLVMQNLLPGNYSIQVTLELANQCDTTFFVNVPDLGNNCGNVSGEVYIDTITNCLMDPSEPGNPARLVMFTPGPYYTVTDSAGSFSTNLPYGTYSASTAGNNFFNTCSVQGITLSALNDTVTGVNLGDSIPYPLDISVSMSSSAARPGFPYELYITLRNNGFETVSSPQVQVNYDSTLSYVSSSLPASVTGTDQITIQFPALVAFTTATAVVDFTLPPDPGLIGYILNNIATAAAGQPEILLSNNTDIYNQAITGSFDPNEKTVWPSRDPMNLFILSSDSSFRYTIRFQNTGNDTAFNIMITDSLSEYLDVSTFSVKGSSHPCHWNFSGGNVLEIHYDNILLPDSNVNEAQSHGSFSFEIYPSQAITSVPLPYTLENTANIFFDFNPPVITNAAFSTIDIVTGVQENVSSDFVLIPNPVNDVLFLHHNMKDIRSIMLLDITGRILAMYPGNSDHIRAEGLAEGIYLLTFESDEQRICRRFIKQ